MNYLSTFLFSCVFWEAETKNSVLTFTKQIFLVKTILLSKLKKNVGTKLKYSYSQRGKRWFWKGFCKKRNQRFEVEVKLFFSVTCSRPYTSKSEHFKYHWWHGGDYSTTHSWLYLTKNEQKYGILPLSFFVTRICLKLCRTKSHPIFAIQPGWMGQKKQANIFSVCFVLKFFIFFF